jgi:hypothetical protein
MAGKLMKHVGMAAATAAATAVAIYFMDGAAFQDFVNGFFKVPDGLLFGNKTTQPDQQSKLVEPAGNSQPIREPEEGRSSIHSGDWRWLKCDTSD